MREAINEDEAGHWRPSRRANRAREAAASPDEGGNPRQSMRGNRRPSAFVLELEKRAGEGGVTPVDHVSGRWW